jgi:hypothetical protein
MPNRYGHSHVVVGQSGMTAEVMIPAPRARMFLSSAAGLRPGGGRFSLVGSAAGSRYSSSFRLLWP